MNLIDESELIAFHELPHVTTYWRFQTTSSKLRRQMEGRKTFELTAYSTTHKFWIFRVNLPGKTAAKSRFKGLTGRSPKWSKSEELFF